MVWPSQRIYWMRWAESIEVESEKGKGSCFEILLDLKIVKDHEVVSTKNENSMESISGMKFLCAEDNELNAGNS